MGDEDKIIKSVNEEELLDISVSLGSTPSPSGHEGEVARAVYRWLSHNGFRPSLQEVVEGRYNVVAKLEGAGGGKSLLFNSHLDTVLYGPDDRWLVGEELKHYNRAWVADGKVYGEGVVNDKGPMAAFMIAAKALREAGIRLRGDVLLTMVVGEIGMAPVDEYQGSKYLGKGLGAKFLVDHGILADCSLVAETTNFGITWAEAGAAYFKLTTRGKRIYTPYLKRPYDISRDPNSILKMARLIEAIEQWAMDYERKSVCRFQGGEIEPKAQIGAIRGGVPYKPSSSPGVCSIYLDVRLAPGADPREIEAELRDVAAKAKVEAEVEMYLYRKGCVGKNIEHIRGAVESAHRSVFGCKPDMVKPAVTSMWRDINIFNEAGIPSITYGPGSGSGEGTSYLTVEDLVKASKLYALIAYYACS